MPYNNLINRFCTIACATLASLANTYAESSKPNILLFITDDQGLSDLAFYGNPSLETPRLDQLAMDSVRLEDFVASPTCSPTRAALMTGQHEFKVGITHTISGRSLLKSNAYTLPEHLKANGYRTAIFGKWHLGETYPSRPQDRGFDEVFIHLGGGIGQTPDFWGNLYNDPQILHNEEWVKTKGYCTAIFTQKAWDWIDNGSSQPWFAYIAYNAPHTPLQIRETLVEKYRKKGVIESQARFYAMIEDIDIEVGAMLDKLDAKDLTENTIVIFMGDNGSAKAGKPSEMEFNAGLRGTKASSYQGGVRIPGFIRWPAGKIAGGRSVNELTSVTDLLPTLAELIGAPLNDSKPIDGRSIVPLLKGENSDWQDRKVVTHVGRWANGDAAKHKHIGSAIRNERFTLVNGTELYDLLHDRGETTNVAKEYPQVMAELTSAYDAWWDSVKPLAEDVEPITVGASAAPVSHLTCMDWGASNIIDDKGFYPPWNQKYVETLATGGTLDHIAVSGAWNLYFAQSGHYHITISTYPLEMKGITAPLKAGSAQLYLGDQMLNKKITDGSHSITFELDIKKGNHSLEALIQTDDNSIAPHGAFFAEIKRLRDL